MTRTSGLEFVLIAESKSGWFGLGSMRRSRPTKTVTG